MLNCADIEDGKMTAVIKGVPVGEYKFTEKTDWSWRYDPNNGNPLVTIDSDDIDAQTGMATAAFANTRDEIYWLDGNYYVDNVFGKLNAAG